MRVYLDMCCLKRPFDDQHQARVAVETAAVIAVLAAAERGELELVRSAAHLLENESDPDEERRSAVDIWLRGGDAPALESPPVREQFSRLRAAGVGRLDALHLAWADQLGAEVVLTTDDRLIAASRRLGPMISTTVLNPAEFVRERGA